MSHHCQKWTDDEIKAVIVAAPDDYLRVAAEIGIAPAYAKNLRGPCIRRVIRLRKELGMTTETPTLRLVRSVQRELA